MQELNTDFVDKLNEERLKEREEELRKIKHYKLVREAKYKKIQEFKKFEKKLGKELLTMAGVVTVLSTALIVATPAITYAEPTTTESTIDHKPIQSRKNTINYRVDATTKKIEIAQQEIAEEKAKDAEENIEEKNIDFSYEARKEEEVTRDDYLVNEAFERRLTDELKESFIECGNNYGVDPYLLIALCMQESSLRQNVNTTSAIGIGQIESTNIGSMVSAYNYNTGSYDSIEITREKLNDVDYNIQITSMMFANKLIKYNGDIFIAIQSYNYGDSMINYLMKLSNVNTYEELKTYIDDVHYNPSKYLGENWNYSKYGDNNYVDNVLRYLPGSMTYVRTSDDTFTIYNVDDNTIDNVYKLDSIDNDSIHLYDEENNLKLTLGNLETRSKGY